MSTHRIRPAWTTSTLIPMGCVSCRWKDVFAGRPKLAAWWKAVNADAELGKVRAASHRGGGGTGETLVVPRGSLVVPRGSPPGGEGGY